MDNLQFFQSLNFVQALKQFFANLQIPVNYIDDKPARPQLILGDQFNLKKEGIKLINEVYVVGMVDDSAFTNSKSRITTTKEVTSIRSDYDGLLIFGITLTETEKNKVTRSKLAEITRAFNRTFPYTPVTIVFKYGHLISFANSERIKYKQEWREGEKVGKVSLLKDIDTKQPHRGHIAILKKLVIPTTGSKAVRSFTQLYYYWQSVFSISVLNKNFYEDIIDWFNKAVKDIKIPDQNAGSEKHKDFTVRLIARLIFIWFLKELKVVKDDLLLPEFDNGEVNVLIKPKSKGTGYYKIHSAKSIF